jgi:hypothetical protein
LLGAFMVLSIAALGGVVIALIASRRNGAGPDRRAVAHG